MSDFSYKILEGFDYILDESNNTFTALRKIAWGNSENYRLDIRKYYNTAEGERMAKGCSFSDDAAHELVKVLVENNYGDTRDIISGIKDRDDFMYSLSKVIGKDNIPETDMEINNSDYFDPNSIFDENEED